MLEKIVSTGSEIVILDITGVPVVDTAVARQLLERESVAVVPGEAFGAPGYIRLSYATTLERIDEGLRRLARFFGRET